MQTPEPAASTGSSIGSSSTHARARSHTHTPLRPSTRRHRRAHPSDPAPSIGSTPRRRLPPCTPQHARRKSASRRASDQAHAITADGQRARWTTAAPRGSGWIRHAHSSRSSLHIIHLFPHLSPGPAAWRSWNSRLQSFSQCTRATVCAPAKHALTARAAGPTGAARAARRRRQSPLRRPPGKTVPRFSLP
jgi:hypothetical protein